MSIERYEYDSRSLTNLTIESIIKLVSWIRRDPDKAIDVGLKIAGFGLLLVVLSEILRD